jgi:hypothetical protein
MKKFSLQIAVLAFAGSLCGALYASEPSVPFASSLGPTNLAVELASDDVHVGPVQFRLARRRRGQGRASLAGSQGHCLAEVCGAALLHLRNVDVGGRDCADLRIGVNGGLAAPIHVGSDVARGSRASLAFLARRQREWRLGKGRGYL